MTTVSIFWKWGSYNVEVHKAGRLIKSRRITTTIADKLQAHFRHHCKRASFYPGGIAFQI